MSMTTLTEELAELEAEAARRFDALAEAVADGLQIDAEDAQLVLKNAKRTAADLSERVALVNRRRELATEAEKVYVGVFGFIAIAIVAFTEPPKTFIEKSLSVAVRSLSVSLPRIGAIFTP